MKQKLIKLIGTLEMNELVSLLSFVQNEDIEFVESAGYTQEEAVTICRKFFENKKPETMRIISKEFSDAHPDLHKKLFISRRTSTASVDSKAGKISLTDNQRLLLNQIKSMVNRSNDGKVRTDFIKVKDKSKFFVGGVITTLIEKNIIKVELIEGKKFASLV